MDLQIHNKIYHYISPKNRLNKPDGELVLLNIEKFENYYKNCGDFYLHPNNGKNCIEGRYERFEQFLQTSSNIEASYVTIALKNNQLVVDFLNGRHRYAVLRDKGIESLPVYMHPDSIELAKKAGLLDEHPMVKDNVIMTRFPHKEKYQLLNRNNESNLTIKVTENINKNSSIVSTKAIDFDIPSFDFTSYHFHQEEKAQGKEYNLSNIDVELPEDIKYEQTPKIFAPIIETSSPIDNVSSTIKPDNQFVFFAKTEQNVLGRLKGLREKLLDNKIHSNKPFKK